MEAIEYFTRVSNSPELINESQKGETVPSLEYSKQFNKWLRQAAGNGHTEAEELVGNEEFYAHSLILRARSPYFKSELSKNCNQIGLGNVTLFDKPNITPERFKLLINEIVGQKNLVFENISLIYQVELSEFAKLSALCKELKIVSTPSLTSNTSVFTNSIQLKIQSNIIEQNHIELIAKWINENTGEILGGYNPIHWGNSTSTNKNKKKLNINFYFNVQLELKIVSTPSLTSNTSVFANLKQLKIQSNLIEQNHIELIAKWINEVSNLNQNTFYTFNLLQRASKHGSTSKVFHKQCDFKGPTIVIMRVKNTEEILGGYNPIHWGNSTSTNKIKKLIILHRQVLYFLQISEI
ncbi:hypothetical protein C2G38_2232563 [Gigaspora rosea]|uniref:BTB domain-containing protein n=1 Tax=Gigaspora rosea TaxID=44941 RepID=A0A397TWY1_9GLOM|nr:hypothetical protein C2G38_2232563 [Gigaspora rosea]